MSPRIKKKQQENICSTTLHHEKRYYKGILNGQVFTWSFFILSGPPWWRTDKNSACKVQAKKSPVVLNSSECTRHTTKQNPKWLFLSMDATSQVITLIGGLIWLFFFSNYLLADVVIKCFGTSLLASEICFARTNRLSRTSTIITLPLFLQ